MELYDLLYRLYEDFETDRLREYQEFVGLFPPVDSRVALEYWQQARDELDARKEVIETAFSDGETFAEVAAHATREQAFTALDLYHGYDRAVNVLVLDVDETLRSAGSTDNEIPRETLHLLTELHEAGMPIVICTGQTLENVKGFMIQGLGSELVHSGDLSIVYEAGTGVFTPEHGAETKQLLYEDLDDEIVGIFDELRARVLRTAPDDLRRGCHLQGNEFNVTIKPNYAVGSERAGSLIDRALCHQLELLGSAVGSRTDASDDVERVREWTRAFYANEDPEIRAVLDTREALPAVDRDDVPEELSEVLERIDVAYYEADAAEIGSRELNKVVGVEAALDVLGIDDPFGLVMGDSKSDLRVMRWLADQDAGLAAAPEHASRDVLDHVRSTDQLVFDRGKSATLLRTIYALDHIARLNGS
jgi:hydroxymethylpyrimidine pyrophosphatase-like HAD family hydrolase